MRKTRGPAAVELVEERVVGHALGDEDDPGRGQLERLGPFASSNVRLPGSMRCQHGAGAHDDAALVQALAHEHVLERLGAERGDRLVARDQLDLAALARQQLGQRSRDEIAVAVVDDDAAAPGGRSRPSMICSGVSTCAARSRRRPAAARA